jgi:hypothetical protein
MNVKLPIPAGYAKNILYLGILAALFFGCYRLLITRMNAFGCFDDCFNYVGGYFINHGKRIYTDFFFNHQLLMPYLSAVIQSAAKTDSIPVLLLRHRQSLFLFGFIASSVIVLRFGSIGLVFSLIYETTKYYLFGDRFLAEGFIVYPLVYLFLTVLMRKRMSWFEAVSVPIAVWFVVFMREPYVPVALVLFGAYMYRERTPARRIASAAIFLGLCGLPFILINPTDFWFNLVTVNAKTVLLADIGGTKLLGAGLPKVFAYPLAIILEGTAWNPFRIYLAALSVILLGAAAITGKTGRWRMTVFVFFVLGTANLRFTPPGLMFYSAFHMLPWYGLFLTATAYLAVQASRNRIAKTVTFAVLTAVPAVFLALPTSYLHERVNQHEEFIINFGQYLDTGLAAKALSHPGTTLYLDGADDLIYVQSGLLSPYRYGWYTSVMPQFETYRIARTDMFRTSPPDLYYRFCSPRPLPGFSLPSDMADGYMLLYRGDKPSCLYVRNAYAGRITDAQWQAAAALGYHPIQTGNDSPDR